MSTWNNLSMREKAAYIKAGVKNGLTDINSISEAYNSFATGGPLNNTLQKPFSYSDIPAVRYGNGGVKQQKPAEYIMDANERIRRQAWAESAGNDKAKSPRGARGRYQIMPDILKSYVENTGLNGNIEDPIYNRAVRDWTMDGIMKSQTITRGDPTDYVKLAKIYAAYNWGLGNLGNYLQKQKNSGVDIYHDTKWIDSMPQEPRDYVNFIVFGKDSGAHRTNALYEKSKTKK